MSAITQLRLLGIRPLEDLLKITISTKFLLDRGVILTDVPYGPLDLYDTLVVDNIYWSRVNKTQMIVLVNPDAPEDSYATELDLWLGDVQQNPYLYVRYTDEFFANNPLRDGI